MPARKQKTTEFKSWQTYLEEATTGLDEFQLPISNEEIITIACPTGDDLIAISEADRRADIATMTRLVFGEHHDRVRELLADAPFPVVRRLVDDIMTHYSLPQGN